jgi:hypothetical protein
MKVYLALRDYSWWCAFKVVVRRVIVTLLAGGGGNGWAVCLAPVIRIDEWLQ